MTKRKHEAAWKLLEQFPIGTHVLVSAIMTDQGKLQRVPGTYTFAINTRQWAPAKTNPFSAWVTGATWKCDGIRRKSSNWSENGNENEGYVSAYLKVTKKTLVLLVRKSMLEKEIAVPVDAVTCPCSGSDVANPRDLAPISPKGYAWTERNRQMMRDDMASWPRDAGGRWISKSKEANK
jgi:hypothetical protein